jgi:hypothetical protein
MRPDTPSSHNFLLVRRRRLDGFLQGNASQCVNQFAGDRGKRCANLRACVQLDLLNCKTRKQEAGAAQ